MDDDRAGRERMGGGEEDDDDEWRGFTNWGCLGVRGFSLFPLAGCCLETKKKRFPTFLLRLSVLQFVIFEGKRGGRGSVRSARWIIWYSEENNEKRGWGLWVVGVLRRKKGKEKGEREPRTSLLILLRWSYSFYRLACFFAYLHTPFTKVSVK